MTRARGAGLGPLRLAFKHAVHHRARSLVLAACVAIAVLMPVTVRLLVREMEEALRARADSTPLLIGARGNRFDLAMTMLYFRGAPSGTISMAEWEAAASGGGGAFIPMNIRFTARGKPIVATTPDYFAARGLVAREGTLPLMLGDATLGSTLAARLGVTVGDRLFSDQREAFDLAKPQALCMKVVGVLGPKGTPDDDAIFVDLKTAWILEGLSHAHTKPSDVAAGLVLERDDRSVRLSEELIDYNEVTEANAPEFHVHGGPELLPLTGVLVIPDSERSAVILTSRHNAGRTLQAVVPTEVVRDLLGYVFRVRAMLDGVAVIVACLTLAMLGLVTALSVRVRSREIATFRRIGVAPRTIAWVFAWEIVILAAAGGVAGLGVAVGVAAAAPDLVKLL
jgi:putative ABC transport system permease protein